MAKYQVPVVFEVDLGDGVAFENPEASLRLLGLDLRWAIEHEYGSIQANLANGEVTANGQRWHLSLDVDWPEEEEQDA